MIVRHIRPRTQTITAIELTEDQNLAVARSKEMLRNPAPIRILVLTSAIELIVGLVGVMIAINLHHDFVIPMLCITFTMMIGIAMFAAVVCTGLADQRTSPENVLKLVAYKAHIKTFDAVQVFNAGVAQLIAARSSNDGLDRKCLERARMLRDSRPLLLEEFEMAAQHVLNIEHAVDEAAHAAVIQNKRVDFYA